MEGGRHQEHSVSLMGLYDGSGAPQDMYWVSRPVLVHRCSSVFSCVHLLASQPASRCDVSQSSIISNVLESCLLSVILSASSSTFLHVVSGDSGGVVTFTTAMSRVL